MGAVRLDSLLWILKLKMSFRAYTSQNKLAVVLASLFVLSACSKQEITLKGNADALTSRTITAGGHEVLYPDDKPSVPDGERAYKQMNCAVCHADNGQGVPGKTTVNLSDKKYGRKTKPVDQFEFLKFGKAGIDHPNVADKLSKRQLWDLVFYVRSLEQPPISEGDKEYLAIDSVFGSNCAVCHGKKGVGDGPLSKNLEPQPANFRNYPRFYDRSDDLLWDHIANGIKWEGMPNFLGKEDKAKNVKFDSDYIWKLVQYVRNFHETNMPTIAQDIQKPGANGTVK
jgi:mono/diheme cytochrome c family protein